MNVVTDVFELNCEIYKIEDAELSLYSCDSGSDKLFSFISSRESIVYMRNFFSSIWEKIAFSDQNGRIKDLEVISVALPIVKEIDEMEKSGALNNHESAKLRKNVMKSCKAFIEVGAYTDDFIVKSTADPRLSMPPEKKLLTDQRPFEPEGPKPRRQGPKSKDYEDSSPRSQRRRPNTEFKNENNESDSNAKNEDDDDVFG